VLTKSKFVRVVLPFLLVATALTVATPSASGIPAPYDTVTKTGDVLCTNGPSGYFSVANGNITSSTNCDGLAAIPEGVTSIGDDAFALSNLSSVTIPNSVISIGNRAFTGTISLTSITIPNTITSIGESAFYSSTLSSINFQETSQLVSIGDSAFFGTSITTISIPNTVSSIGENAFESSLLTSITLPSSLTTIKRETFRFSQLTTVIIPSSVTVIEPYAFAASALQSVNFPNTLTTIGDSAFFGTALTSLTIPSSVTSIDVDAFSGYSGDGFYTYCGNLGDDELFVAGLWPFIVQRISECVPGAPTIGTATATGTTTATVAFSAPASDGNSTITFYTATSNPGGITATIAQAGSGTISLTGLSPATSYTFTVNARNAVGTSLASPASNSITTSSALASGVAPLFTAASSYDGRFTVQIKDYDSAFTYAVATSAGQASINSTGLVTVTGLLPDQSVTVSVTTTRTGYASGSGSITGRSQVAPMLPGTKPVIETTETTIMCTIGSYSATPTSAAFSLFVDGKHVSTIFSALGDFLPDWIIPWATSATITRTATLTSATWTISDAYKGKSITCATLAYSKNAIGFTASQALIAR
jgi:hypothetical protein